MFIVDDDEEMPEFKARTSAIISEKLEEMFEVSGINKRLKILDGCKAIKCHRWSLGVVPKNGQGHYKLFIVVHIVRV